MSNPITPQPARYARATNNVEVATGDFASLIRSGEPGTGLLLTKQISRIEVQGAAHRPNHRKRAGEQHRKYDCSKYKWVRADAW